MAIQVNGLGSGLDYDTWIEELVAVKQSEITKVSKEIKTINTQESTLSTLQGYYDDLLSSIQTFTNALSTTSVFSQKSATSSDEAVSVSVDSSAEAQNISVAVSQLATATTAKGASTVASYVDSSTVLSNISEGSLTEGTFTIYVNGQKNELTIDKDSTLGSLVTQIDGLTGVSASLTDGKLTVSAENGYNVVVGSNADTSNFSNVMSLTRDADTGVYSSSKAIFDTDTTAALTSTAFAAGTVKAGTFTIGDEEFTISASTTLDGLIETINASDAGVMASWDSNAGKLVLESNDEGAININIEAGTSNFTDIMGLTSSTWDAETGEMLTTKLADNSQTLGTNAILSINGTTITSSSNTVTSDISGLKGITLTLNDETTSTATVNVTNDNTKVSDAVTEFVNAFNIVMVKTNNATASDGSLYGESVLNSIKNNLRKLATASVGVDSDYKTLASIGISTGKIGTSVDEDTNQLELDSAVLTKALTDNPDAVKKLLLGEGSTAGVFDKLESVLDGALDSVSGYFVKREDSYESQIDKLNDKVDKMTTAMEKYQKQLEIKFQAMDELISSLQNEASIFDSYFNNKNNNEDN